MANVSLTLGPGLMLQGGQSGLSSLSVTRRTASLTPTTSDSIVTVTITPGTHVSFIGSIAPAITSGSNVVVPSSVSLNNDQYVMTCTNSLTSGSAICGFGMSVSIASPKHAEKQRLSISDPTMIFYPPQ